MDKIKENDKIKNLNKIAELSKGIIAKVQSMPDLQELKLDLDIILYVCNIIIDLHIFSSTHKKHICTSVPF